MQEVRVGSSNVHASSANYEVVPSSTMEETLYITEAVNDRISSTAPLTIPGQRML
jgi:hypothetical protein